MDLTNIGNEEWREVLKDSFCSSPFIKLQSFLEHEKLLGRVIYPNENDVFNAFVQTPFKDVKVVILGQDPYHGVGQAHGLSFSVKKGVKIPPSLLNIYKELQRDFKKSPPLDGDLTAWARQGVLLLNATLTVEDAKPASHQNKGWEEFTDDVIKILNDKKDHVVFMLWGACAQKKGSFINTQKHLVLKSVHPSPLSAHRGFIGCGHFSTANAYLKKHGQTEIEWI